MLGVTHRLRHLLGLFATARKWEEEVCYDTTLRWSGGCKGERDGGRSLGVSLVI
jgi:hypothetical protein